MSGVPSEAHEGFAAEEEEARAGHGRGRRKRGWGDPSAISAGDEPSASKRLRTAGTDSGADTPGTEFGAATPADSAGGTNDE